MYVLHSEQRLRAPLDEVFAFFARPENLERITPSWLRFSILTPSPVPMTVGQRIDYRLSLFGLPFSWRSEISAYEPPHRFVDEQRRGPYRRWHHQHRFRQEGEVTVVEDVVHYEAPLGRVAQFLVAPQLRRIFQGRRRALAEVFEEVSFSGVRIVPAGERPVEAGAGPSSSRAA